MARIALVVPQFPSREHPYIWDWVKELISAGLDVTVVTENTLADSEIYSDDKLLSRVLLLNSLASPGASLLSNWRPNVRSIAHPYRIAEATRILSDHEQKRRTVVRKLYEYLPILSCSFDIVHFNAPQIAIRRFELGRIFNAKTVISFRGQDFTFYPDRYDRLLQEADHLHFISDHLLQEAQKRGYDGSKHSLIPPMVDTEFYHPQAPNHRKRSSESFMLFTAARLSWTKGWEYALQAVALLIEQGLDVHYYIAGDGDFREAVVYTINELDLEERVHLLGWLTPEQIREWVWKADLYILASVNEAFNNSVLQAQACGVPVVCSDAGGLPENIVDGETGLLASRRDAWDLAEKANRLLDRDAIRYRLGIAASERIARQFTLKQHTRAFVGLYKNL